ncbi:protein SSUH2 homolog [Ictalurus furcatus]|uniref:protein SSUH2 homolog n=1 Tax=Ictalurus furcatus TaxID=66913 RepID=UPI002350403F|nr:protein SSUH2 homolog [Ictalurus furcatus]
MYAPVHGMGPPLTQPLLYGMQTPPNPVPGFDGIGGGFLPPPPIQPMPTPDSQPAQDWSIPALTKEEAQEAFHNFANSNCCYSTGPATDGVITNMEQFNTYRYRLETYTESRKTEWATKPYEGQPLNTYAQIAPNPWEVPVQVPAMFTNSTEDVEVPCTASVKPCDQCSASGKCQCTKCCGSKTRQCSMCRGSGKVAEEQVCEKCNGTGKVKCPGCSGQGTTVCDTCKGKQNLLTYIKLIVEWKNNVDDYIVEQSSGLQKDKLETITGKKLIKDTKFMVYPLSGFPEHNVAQASERMVMEHHSKFSKASRIIQQQQSVELIPITKVTYKWNEKDYVYFVYGNELKVKAVDYPATCCCTIM